jgi:hypothetical protein
LEHKAKVQARVKDCWFPRKAQVDAVDTVTRTAATSTANSARHRGNDLKAFFKPVPYVISVWL